MDMIPFPFEDKEVRVVRDESGEPLFVGKDVCDLLGHASPSQTFKHHCKDVARRLPIPTNGGMQSLRVLTKADVLRLLMHSHSRVARQFEQNLIDAIHPFDVDHLLGRHAVEVDSQRMDGGTGRQSARKMTSTQEESNRDARHPCAKDQSMQVVPYQFENQEVRVIPDENGEMWFVAADVCSALNVSTEQTRRLDDDEKGLRSMQTPGGPQEMTVVNESGLYNLILGSRKPQAKAFKRWVTHDVLPAIRRTGRYAAPQTEQPGKEPGKLGVDTDWLARSMHNAQKVIQMAAGRVGMAVVAEETPDFSHPDIAMGLAGLMFARQRFLVEMESLESARIRALHIKERIVDLRPDDWADRFLGELNRAQAVQIMQAATRKLA